MSKTAGPARLAGVIAVVAMALPNPVSAQPAPPFSTTCEGLTGEIAALGPIGDTLVTIEVTGELQLATRDDALAYMGLCGPPQPRILCVTYELNDYRVGDRVAGAYRRDAPDFITLDPCLHYPPGDR